jgi:uracil-DNA glycosylase
MAGLKEQLGDEWYELLKTEFKKPYMHDLQAKLSADRKKLRVWPKKEDTFRALRLTQFSDVKVVILGQDPYPGRGIADGLAFSTRGEYRPASLHNLFLELETDYSEKEKVFQIAHNNDLERWARQGVLLLNTSLSVVQGNPGSHSRIGWQYLTKRIIKMLSERRGSPAFVLWGRYAQGIARQYVQTSECVIRSPHPSPRSASRGFFGSRPYTRVNTWLEACGREPIDWLKNENK